MLAERVTQAFWPFWTVLFATLAPLMMGWQDRLPVEVVWGFGVVMVLALIAASICGGRYFTMPKRAEAMARVDARLPGRPIAALADQQAIGAGDPASEAIWQTHLERMAARSRDAKAVAPDLRVASRDPYGLRYVALLAFVVAFMFGSLLRVGSVADLSPNGEVALASGPVWEGWVAPPAYTGKPTLYLADIPVGVLRVPEGSTVTLRLYSDVGALTVHETVSGRVGEVESASAAQQAFVVEQDGRLEIDGSGGAVWDVSVIADAAPSVSITAPIEADASGQMAQAFVAEDDYAVVSGMVTITLDLEAVDRRYGLAIAPDPIGPLILDLPMPYTGDRTSFQETLIDNLSEHPLANLPVTLQLQVTDAREQVGMAPEEQMILPGRRFFQPVAKAVIEQRRDLLWSKDNDRRVLQVLRALSHRPGDLFRNETTYLRTRQIIRDLASFEETGMTAAQQIEMAQALWDLAIQLEDGNLADARERLARAQERLAEAMRNGASDEEIAELMNELREAMDDYMSMLAQNAEPAEDGTDQPDRAEGDGLDVSRDELQALMDRIQELMEEGRMADAADLMEQLNELMENLTVTQGEGGDGPQTPGEQSMEELADTLRDQQQLNDEAFRDLQEQFNPGRSEQPDDQPQPGRGQQGEQSQGQEGQGEDTPQQPGDGSEPGQDGQDGEGMGQGDRNEAGRQAGDGAGAEGQSGTEQSLADRQEALRQGLQQLRDRLPSLPGESGEEARRALEQAEDAMDDAEDALRDGDLAEAIDRQAEAMDALREGMRNLGRALAENYADRPDEGQGGQQGDVTEQTQTEQRDPLGRQIGNTGQYGSDDNMLQGEDVYRHAEELLEELRRRSADQGRPEVELDYLKRLLDRF